MGVATSGDLVVESQKSVGFAWRTRKVGRMEIVWSAVGLCGIVCFLFCVLAGHWRRVLGQQAQTIRRLAERVQNLEELGDPQLRQRIGESAPMPLEQVFIFSFRLSDRFWRDKLQIKNEDWDFIRKFGSFVGSVKLEKWRSHTVATVTEVLPDSRTARWQARSLDFYPDPLRTNDALTLWELRLGRARELTELPPSLELLLRRNELELRGHRASSMADSPENGQRSESSDEEVVFFRVPLDKALLAEFRAQDPADVRGNGNGGSERTTVPAIASSWQEFYAHPDEHLGVEWQLRLRDLNERAEWERSKILKSAAIPPNQGIGSF
jgi:hypothetical protein